MLWKPIPDGPDRVGGGIKSYYVYEIIVDGLRYIGKGCNERALSAAIGVGLLVPTKLILLRRTHGAQRDSKPADPTPRILQARYSHHGRSAQGIAAPDGLRPPF